MALLDFLGLGDRRRRFVEQVTEGLRAGGWPHPIEADHRSLQLNLGERLGSVDLEPFLRRWVKAPRSERDAAVREAIGFVAELDADQGFEATRDLLVPAVRSMELALAELYGAEAQSDQNWRPLTANLAVYVAVDRRYSMSFLSPERLREWGLPFDDLLQIAVANLRERPALAFERDDAGFHVSAGTDGNDVAYLLAPEAFDTLRLQGAPVAIPATRDCLLLAGAEDIGAIEAMAIYAQRLVRQHGPVVALAPIIWSGEGWREYEPGPDQPAVLELRAMQKEFGDVCERPLLTERLRRQGRPAEVGGLSFIPADLGPQSVALWTAPQCLLPRADYIVVRAPGGTFARTWEDVEVACGGLPVEPNTSLPYHRTDAWPSDEALARIEAAAEPDWAEGRGVGVANGRLTLFG